MKLLISLPDAMKNQGLTVNLAGRSGADYPFVWNDKHCKHIYLGQELNAKQFNDVARDIFSLPRFDIFPVAEAYVDPYVPDEDDEVAKKPKVAKKLKEEPALPEKDLAPSVIEEPLIPESDLPLV